MFLSLDAMYKFKILELTLIMWNFSIWIFFLKCLAYHLKNINSSKKIEQTCIGLLNMNKT